jgi:uncharacterized membrane protein
LIALVGTFVILLALRLARGGERPTVEECGSVAMSAMLVLTGVSHFSMPDVLAEMLPEATPARLAIIYGTGLIELAAAVGLLVPATRRATGLCLVAFFVAVLPANVWAALHGTGPGSPGPSYLVFRVPLQALFVAWAWYFTRPSRAGG